MDALADPVICEFDGFVVDPHAGSIFRLQPDGRRTLIPLGSRTFQILCLLTARAGEVVSRQQIMDAVWPGIAVEENNLNVQVSTLRRVLDAGRAQGSCIQTIPGRGYRLTSRVTPAQRSPATDLTASGVPADMRDGHMVEPAEAAESDGTERNGCTRQFPGKHRLLHLPQIAAALLAFAILGAGVWFAGLLQAPSPSSTRQEAKETAGTNAPASERPRLSLVVLPFQNLSGNPAEDYLADGITDDVTSDIARVPGVFVTSRQSAEFYQGKSIDIRQIGRDLGVRYALEGSVRKIGDALRVNAQLIATETGAHLWADRFDQAIRQINNGQEAIVRRVAQSLDIALFDVESARSNRERPNDPDVFDLVLRARSLGHRGVTAEAMDQRIRLYEEAIRRDPTAAVAMAELAGTLIQRSWPQYGKNAVGDELERAAALISVAASIAPNHFGVLGATAALYRGQQRYPEAVAADQRLLELYPNTPSAYTRIGLALTAMGRSEEAVPMLERAILLDPRGPWRFVRLDMLGFAHLMLGHDEDAIQWTHRALTENPNIPPPRLAMYQVRLAGAYARLGRLEEARAAVAEANRVWPYDTVRTHWPDGSDNAVYHAQMRRWQDAMRAAGHRDHADEDADFGVQTDDRLRSEVAGPTPLTITGATTIRTAELAAMLDAQRPIVIDAQMYSWGRTLPGGIALRYGSGFDGRLDDAVQDRLRRKMTALTDGDLSRPIVAVGFNAERFDGYNLALRLVDLGYTNVYWYRGGREAWEAAGLPGTEVRIETW